MSWLFTFMLKDIFKRAGIGLIFPNNRIIVMAESPAPSVTFHHWRDLWRLLLSPELAFCEAFAHGRMTIKNGRIYDVAIRFAESGTVESKIFILARFFKRLFGPIYRLFEGMTPKQSKKNVHAHYDLGNDFYQLFLDKDMQYSCAYFKDASQDLTQAQQQKKDHIIKKLDLKPNAHVLDIGCGWGGLSLDLALKGAEVTGITLSEEQFALACKRGEETNLNVNFKLKDYRLEENSYDRIVSVGMFEHVGPQQFQRYFDQVAKNLRHDGIALIHTIGRPIPPRRVSRFTTKYIFPGGYIPSLSQIATTVERSGLLITDVECLYMHYAETLKHWRLNFIANRDKAVAMYDERFALIWECYLAGSEAAFRTNELLVFQTQLKHPSAEAHLTRDYIYQD